MHYTWFGIAAVIAVVGMLASWLATMQTFEHRRFLKRRRKKPPYKPPLGRVAVFAPCKGLDLGLADNLRPLFEQDHPDFELVFIVESSADPASEVVRLLMKACPDVTARLVVAGRASRSGQKVHNLRWATANLASDIRFLAFVDSDARPGRDWLRLLVQRLHRPKVGAATGYRWFVPARPTLANRLLYSINAAVATMMGPGNKQHLWGGSWAIRKDTFDQLGIRDAWQGRLNDDLVATCELQRAGMRVEFEPSCVVPSPIDVSFRELLTFVRRQYLQGRCHVGHSWIFALIGVCLSNLALWGSTTLAVWAAARGSAWALAPAAIGAVLGALGMWRARMRREVAAIYFGDSREAQTLTAAARFDAWAWPLAGLVHAVGLLASAWGDRVTWRDIRYHVAADGRILRLRRLGTSVEEAEERMDAPESEPTPLRRPQPTARRAGTTSVPV